MRGLIDRLRAVRHIGISNHVLQAIPAHRARAMAQEGRLLARSISRRCRAFVNAAGTNGFIRNSAGCNDRKQNQHLL
jgi:hypothetical protein